MTFFILIDPYKYYYYCKDHLLYTVYLIPYSDNPAVHLRLCHQNKAPIRPAEMNARLQYVVPLHNRRTCTHARTLHVPFRRLFRAAAPSTARDNDRKHFVVGTAVYCTIQCTGPQPPVSTLASNMAPLAWKQEPWIRGCSPFSPQLLT